MKKIWEREMWMVLGFLAGCFALGLLGGILFANLAYPWRNGQNQMLELYAPVSYTHLDVYKRQPISFAFLTSDITRSVRRRSTA